MGDNIQELITKYSADKDADTYRRIINELKAAKILWAAVSPYTNNYYIDSENSAPTAYIFTDKESFEDFRDNRSRQTISVNCSENQNEQRMQLFGDLYVQGFERIAVDSGKTSVQIGLFDIIDKPDFSNTPEIKIPVMNPAFVRAADFFFQELGRKKATKAQQNQMFREIYNAKFLIPIDTSKMNTEKKNADSGEIIVKKDSTMSFPILTNAANKQFYPLFTDWNELKKYDKEGKFSGSIVKFDDMKFFAKNANGIVINPFSINITLDSDMLGNIESAATGKPVVQKQTVEKETTVQLGPPRDYPQKMVDEISKYLKTEKNVSAAYLQLMIKDGEQSFLIVVDFVGDKSTLFNGIATVAASYSNGLPLYFIPLSDRFGKSATENVEPFYRRRNGIFKNF